MKTIVLVLALASLSFIPSASAADPLGPVPVGACVKVDACSGGNDVCFGAFHWVPQCVDVCNECVDLSVESLPPLVGVCIAGTTHSGCYRDGAICVSVSEMVPQCIPKQN